MINKHLYETDKRLDSYLSNHDNILVIGGFNSEITESSMPEVCSFHNLNSLCSEPTY